MDGCYEIWLISWLPEHSTGFHDHGEANGAFSVVWGTLDESVVPRRGTEVTVRPVTQGVVRAFGPHYVHDVSNTTDSVAVSIHAYSPPLTAMTRYRLTGSGLVPATTGVTQIDPAIHLDVILGSPRKTTPRLALSNSLAFGGLNAVLALRPF